MTGTEAFQEGRIMPRTTTVSECPMCGSPNTDMLFESPDRLHGVQGTFTYDKCGNCGTVFQNPMVRMEDLHLCYPRDYKPYNYDPFTPDFDLDSLRDSGFKGRLRSAIAAAVWGEGYAGAIGKLGKVLSRSRTLRERAFYGVAIDECIPRKRGLKALEIGCGTGWMLKRLSKVGWDVEGVEWDKDAAAIAREKTGAVVYEGDFRDSGIEDLSCDLIFMSHVFEHINAPNEVLKWVGEKLREDGLAVFALPNSSSVDSKYFGEYWFAWDPPRHLVLPPAEAIENAAVEHGLSMARCYSNASGHVWQHSKSYKMGIPVKEENQLSNSELIRFNYSAVLAKLGILSGSELVTVLQKSR